MTLKTIPEYFLEVEKRNPHHVFLYQPFGKKGKCITYKEAGVIIRKLVAGLYSMGLKPGDHVGILSKNCYHWILSDLAIMGAGMISVPFYPNLTKSQLETVIHQSDIKALFLGKLDTWDGISSKYGNLQIIKFPHYPGNALIHEGENWDEFIESIEPVSSLYIPKLEDTWTILFTSGTTGIPKGVMLSYHSPAAIMENEMKYGNLRIFAGKSHRYFSFLPLNHIAERMIVEIACLFTSGTIYFGESIDTFAYNLKKASPTLFMAVPRIWSKFQAGIFDKIPPSVLSWLLKVPLVRPVIQHLLKRALGLHKARILLTGAAPMPDALKNWYKSIGIHIQEVYAMTENCGGCTLMRINDIQNGTVGKPLPEVEVKIENNSGEVLMKAPWLMKGYYKDSEKTAETIKNGWLHTGDKGELTKDGHLKLTGRVTDTFKSAKGKYIEPAPIEWMFAENKMIEQIAVAGLGLPQPLALICLNEWAKKLDKSSIAESLLQTLQQVNDSLAKFQQVSCVIIVKSPWSVENELLTPTLKIKRPQLETIYSQFYEYWINLNQPVIWE
jgi:long-chain acyl-CoA synthetase